MCELLAEPLSDSDEDISQQNIFNSFLNIVTTYQSGARLEAFLTEAELARIGLGCLSHWTPSATIGEFYNQ